MKAQENVCLWLAAGSFATGLLCGAVAAVASCVARRQRRPGVPEFDPTRRNELLRRPEGYSDAGLRTMQVCFRAEQGIGISVLILLSAGPFSGSEQVRFHGPWYVWLMCISLCAFVLIVLERTRRRWLPARRRAGRGGLTES